MPTVRLYSVTLRHRRSRLRLWLAFASLLSLQLFPAAGSAAQDLHGMVCSAAVQLMLGESADLRAPRVNELRAVLPQLNSQLQSAMQRLTDNMDSLSNALRTGQPLSQQQHEAFNNALLDTLTLLRPSPSTPGAPLADLPERLDFALLLYVSWSQIGSLRPAREQPDSYLGWDVYELAASIEQDLLRDDWLPGDSPEQLQLLRDAQTRWHYIAKLLHRATADPAPLSVSKQIGLIRKGVLQLRRQPVL
ncbi:hypothetical protein [Zestomonas carbonaria]|uniref:Uncharacterized protein n=1 Tax=Zestomonas carbonaria TaxID=2762745 RepID=A0A7U7I8S5_9GAMM|nr:hypothetical protein [Pseudomonas carbonaria]CAD5107456.1 hypothetical protein PSEWESI4_01729 [Pseudomonas carbonaria]